MSDSIIKEEVDKFSALAKEWWNKEGKFKVLHQFNIPRVNFISACLSNYTELNGDFENINILDIGCGGGILTEELAKMGFTCTALDASLKAIEVARIHAQESKLDINYLNSTAEDFLSENPHKQVDIIFAMEIIEHVSSPNNFIKTCLSLLKPNGLLFVSTINRNLKSLALAKIMAEYVLQWLPKNTHDFSKFITPRELEGMFEKYNAELIKLKGINYNLFNQTWDLVHNPSVNYICCAKKL